MSEIVDIMNIIEPDDRQLLENRRIVNMSRIDWGKTMAVSNQYIQRNILRYLLSPFGYSVYSVDDTDFLDILSAAAPIETQNINIGNNSQGFDLVIISPENKYIKIQSKLRQVRGNTDFSQTVHFETTRRHSEKNKDKNHTGHICYSMDEFDYVMISLVNDKKDRNNIINCNLWSYCFIPVADLQDKTRNNCCRRNITPEILKRNVIKMTDDIRFKLS